MPTSGSREDRQGRPSPQDQAAATESGRKSAVAGDDPRLDNILDEALEGTFPASDPVAVGGAD
jgi:hypothetical protein